MVVIYNQMKIYLFYNLLLSCILSIPIVLKAQQSEPTKIEVYSTSIVKKNAEQPLQNGMVEVKDGGFGAELLVAMWH